MTGSSGWTGCVGPGCTRPPSSARFPAPFPASATPRHAPPRPSSRPGLLCPTSRCPSGPAPGRPSLHSLARCPRVCPQLDSDTRPPLPFLLPNSAAHSGAARTPARSLVFRGCVRRPRQGQGQPSRGRTATGGTRATHRRRAGLRLTRRASSGTAPSRVHTRTHVHTQIHVHTLTCASSLSPLSLAVSVLPLWSVSLASQTSRGAGRLTAPSAPSHPATRHGFRKVSEIEPHTHLPTVPSVLGSPPPLPSLQVAHRGAGGAWVACLTLRASGTLGEKKRINSDH